MALVGIRKERLQREAPCHSEWSQRRSDRLQHATTAETHVGYLENLYVLRDVNSSTPLPTLAITSDLSRTLPEQVNGDAFGLSASAQSSGVKRRIWWCEEDGLCDREDDVESWAVLTRVSSSKASSPMPFVWPTIRLAKHAHRARVGGKPSDKSMHRPLYKLMHRSMRGRAG